MRSLVTLMALAAISLCCNAQFVLTPEAGMMTADGPYTFLREGSESENYEAARKAVQRTVTDAEIGDVEYEKSFNVTSAFKDHRRLPGALIVTDWKTEYTLFVECADGKIMFSYKHFGPLKVTKKNEHFLTIYPTTGKNSMFTQISGIQYIFNSKGVVAKGCKKMKDIFEEYANSLVKNIENNLKEQ